MYYLILKIGTRNSSMNYFKIRALLDTIIIKLQDFRSNTVFLTTIQTTIKHNVETLENYLHEKEFLIMMKEAILANSDLTKLILNNSK